MEGLVSDVPHSDPEPLADQRRALLALYDSALPEVYGYLYRRCESASVAEDLTSETFLAAVDSLRRRRLPSLTVAWLITVARNKLVDYWRRAEREQRMLDVVTRPDGPGSDRWEVDLDRLVAHETLAALGPPTP
jgi:RNA polymerase sigma-70 factor, ECF subfamily